MVSCLFSFQYISSLLSQIHEQVIRTPLSMTAHYLQLCVQGCTSSASLPALFRTLARINCYRNVQCPRLCCMLVWAVPSRAGRHVRCNILSSMSLCTASYSHCRCYVKLQKAHGGHCTRQCTTHLVVLEDGVQVVLPALPIDVHPQLLSHSLHLCQFCILRYYFTSIHHIFFGLQLQSQAKQRLLFM